MIVTEEEAKTKWCPEARANLEAENRSAEWYGQDADVPPEFRCIGSACMAWRWHWPEQGSPTPNTDRGYCGKAGKP